MPYPGPLEDLPDFVDESLDLPNPADYEVAPYQQQDYGRRGLLESLGGLESLNLPAPRSFGMGFAQGLAGSLGTAGTRVQERRAKFESRQAQRAAQTDAARIQASRDYRKDRGTALRTREAERIRGDREKAKYEQENPLVDEALLAKYPEIPKRMMGARISQDFINKFALEEPGRELDRQRRASADARAEATAGRAADAAERSARALLGTSEGRLVDDYRVHPAVKAYQNVRANIQTAEVARKQKNGVGDVALIFSYMRALEPDNPNVVREGDFKVARLAAGKLQSLKTAPARFFSGDMLTEEGRNFFLRQMNQSLNARKPAFEAANQQFKRRAAGVGVPPENVITEYRDTPQGLGSDRDFSPYIIPDEAP